MLSDFGGMLWFLFNFGLLGQMSLNWPKPLRSTNQQVNSLSLLVIEQNPFPICYD